MSTNRVEAVEKRLDAALAGAEPAARALAASEPLAAGTTLTARAALALFEDMLLSRQLDAIARELKKSNQSFYTISSAGHELNAVLGAQLRLTDPCFLHYRSGALVMARARHLPGSTPLFDTLLSLVASKDDPIAQGRHKVWGSRPLWIPPQTSTIASHLPKAMGLAFALPLARRLRVESGLPGDAIVMCSFGDASSNHATALAGLNAARYAKKLGQPVPILWVCEDNGIGISVDTPRDWIRENFGGASHMAWFEAKGEIDEVWETCAAAVSTCRRTRGPVFLRLRTERLWGHAGSDVETTYRTLGEIEAVESRDPLVRVALRLIASGAATPAALQDLVQGTRERVAAAAREAVKRPRLATREEVLAPLAPYDEAAVRAEARKVAPAGARERHFGAQLPEKATSATRRTLAAHVNSALQDELLRRGELIVFGEDVGKKGGVYGVTQGLQERFGVARCFDTLLDETSILGIAQGAAHIGLLPLPEIQYLAYVHNALDQLRGEACSLSFFSNGQFTNPMVVRIQGLAYQKGFGGHFHNDNSIGALRDIPGLVLAVPSRGDDAARMLRGCVALAKACARVVCFLEPIALYHERDLYAPGDSGWLGDYPAPDGSDASTLLPGQVEIQGERFADVLIVSYANCFRLSLRAARALADRHGLSACVLDCRWLNPLPLEAIASHARECGGVLVADECRATGGGIADAIGAHLMEAGHARPVRSVRAADCYVPLGSSTACVLVGEDDIVRGALDVARAR
jgi:2-oxoisovalerate dehydrogenase E1 component